MLDALAEDHINDVLSNSAAIITAAIAFNTTVNTFIFILLLSSTLFSAFICILLFLCAQYAKHYYKVLFYQN